MPYLSMDHQVFMRKAPEAATNAGVPYEATTADIDRREESVRRFEIPWAPGWHVLRGSSVWRLPEPGSVVADNGGAAGGSWVPREAWSRELLERYEDEVLRGKVGTRAPSRTRGPYLVWAFGDGPQLADELLALVLDGSKTATCGSVAAYEQEREPLPKVGDISVVTDGRGIPGAVIRTREAVVRPFGEVDAAFAYEEGEGDRSLEFWRRVHEAVFRREQEETGVPFSEKLPVVCERFEVVARFDEE